MIPSVAYLSYTLPSLSPTYRVFHSLYKVGRNGIIGMKGFNNSKQKLPPVGFDLMQKIITGLGVQCPTN